MKITSHVLDMYASTHLSLETKEESENLIELFGLVSADDFFEEWENRKSDISDTTHTVIAELKYFTFIQLLTLYRKSTYKTRNKKYRFIGIRNVTKNYTHVMSFPELLFYWGRDKILT